LTYFSAKDISVGDVVEINIRNKNHDAIVISVKEVKDLKQEIKTATFGFKKIQKVKNGSKFYKEFFKACEDTKKFFVGNLGQIASYFISTEFLQQYENLPSPKKKMVGSSVYHIVPTILGAENLFNNISKSDSDSVFLIHGKLNKKKQLSIYKQILERGDPVTVIMTPSFVFIPRHDLGKIVLHDEQSPAYRTIKRPYFDLRFFLKTFAKETKIKIDFSGKPLTLETILENKINITQTSHSKINIVDMANKENCHNKSFIFSKKVFEEIQKSDKAFAFALRKGLGSSVVCHDCGQILKDGDTTLVLRKRGEQRILLNVKTGETLDPRTRCNHCESWNFDTLGIGTDIVTEEAKKLFPKKNIFQIDSDVTKTNKKVREVIEKFYATPQSILIGTELVIPYLKTKVDFATLISMDSLLSIPNYKMSEKMLYLGLIIKDLGEKSIIQTRDTENLVMETITSGDLKKFYDSEKKLREKFGYPPFGTIIKISRNSKRDDFDRAVGPLISQLSTWNPIARRIKRGKTFETIIITKISQRLWNEDFQDQNLFEILSSLTPDWQIRVNPDSLF
jgi:primosomal protein N'